MTTSKRCVGVSLCVTLCCSRLEYSFSLRCKSSRKSYLQMLFIGNHLKRLYAVVLQMRNNLTQALEVELPKTYATKKEVDQLAQLMLEVVTRKELLDKLEETQQKINLFIFQELGQYARSKILCCCHVLHETALDCLHQPRIQLSTDLTPCTRTQSELHTHSFLHFCTRLTLQKCSHCFNRKATFGNLPKNYCGARTSQR